MPSFLVGSSYAISVGLIIYGISARIIPLGIQFPIIILWAVAGIVLGFFAIAPKSEQTGKNG